MANKKMDLRIACTWCGLVFTITVNQEDMEAYKRGTYVLNAFPYLSADERELIVSQTCGECWDNMFKEV